METRNWRFGFFAIALVLAAEMALGADAAGSDEAEPTVPAAGQPPAARLRPGTRAPRAGEDEPETSAPAAAGTPAASRLRPGTRAPRAGESGAEAPSTIEPKVERSPPVVAPADETEPTTPSAASRPRASRHRPGPPAPQIGESEPEAPAAIYPEGERYRPGAEPAEAQPPEVTDPNRATQLERVPSPAPAAPGDFIPIPDRWRLAKDLGLVKEPWYDPYNRNLLKADRPVYRDWFVNLSVISDSTLELRSVPTPVAPQVSNTAGSLDTFGGSDQLLFNQNFIFSLIAYKGNTVFKPPDYEFRLTPVVNVSHAEVEELRVLHIDPRDGDTRDDAQLAMQELFLDVHIRNVSDRYDFDSVRFGIQPFSTDFRGFLFQDNQLGIRFFGSRDNNIWQYNVAWFRRLEKDTNSGLNDISDDPRDDDTVLGNLYRQDFPVRGFTSQATVVYNRNREGDDGLFFDDNGFLARPATLGHELGRDYDVIYLGYNGDGHFGRLNLTGSFYYALGDESRGTFIDAETDVRAWFVAAEASVDFDWIRPRASVVYASGDDDAFDETSQGFDAIFENPLIAGADTSYWIRQGIPNIGGGGVTLQTRNGVLGSLRSSKEHGQSNFTNPGVELYGLGADLDVLPELRVSANANKLFFEDTTILEVARNQGRIDSDIGWDLSLAFIYRPFFTQNIVGRLSGAVLVPGDGFRDLFVDQVSYSVLGNIILTY